MTYTEFITTLPTTQLQGLFIMLTMITLIVVFALLFFIGTTILKRT